MKIKILVLVLAALLISPCAFAVGVGKVTYVEGRVDISRAGLETAIPLREGEEISVGDSLRTKSNSRAEVDFYDKSKLRLAQNSRVEITDYQLDNNNRRKTATIKLDRGKSRTIISKMPDAADFNILTPNAEGKVKGSDIFTFYQAGTSGMLVAEGNLALKSIAHPEASLAVPAGNSAVVNIEGAASGPRPYMELEKKLHEQDTCIPPSVSKKGETASIKGALVKMAGDVRITTKGASASHDAGYNEILGEGDTIETGDNGMVEIKFDNGCGLNLKPNTQITITKLIIDPRTGEYQNLFESSKGKIRARIENLKGKSSFEIKTPIAICGARGTIMYVLIT
ncbi:MAG: FecR domain-containing protein, partial [Candidatus Omnitrophota bacterium]|nr:FecR domain-containing protein [Candidatus Omnitrophota bacterium]